MDSKFIFHEGRWVSVKLCDNAYFNSSNCGYGIRVSPQCLDGLAEIRVKIQYDEVEKVSCYLCGKCYQALKKSASLYGY